MTDTDTPDPRPPEDAAILTHYVADIKQALRGEIAQLQHRLSRLSDAVELVGSPLLSDE